MYVPFLWGGSGGRGLMSGGVFHPPIDVSNGPAVIIDKQHDESNQQRRATTININIINSKKKRVSKKEGKNNNDQQANRQKKVQTDLMPNSCRLDKISIQ